MSLHRAIRDADHIAVHELNSVRAVGARISSAPIPLPSQHLRPYPSKISNQKGALLEGNDCPALITFVSAQTKSATLSCR
jgi:hypothetical protein